MRYVFGPVPSRRLGVSLGVDPIPLKTCNFNCVYCQLGRSRHLAAKRRAFASISGIGAEIASALGQHQRGSIDWVTFVGSGETTLSSGLGAMIRYVKSITDLPVAVITNGSLLGERKVSDELVAADAVLPSLDAGTELIYRKINRPGPGRSFERHVDGLIRFRKLFRGSLWLEVMLVGGVNDSESALNDLANLLDLVEPDEIHLATPTRPPAEPWVRPPGVEAIERASTILGRVSQVLQPVNVAGAPALGDDLAEEVVKIIRRHPLDDSEIRRVLTGWVRDRVEAAMGTVAETGGIQFVERFGRRFWCSAGLDYPSGPEAGDGSPAMIA